MGSKPSLGLTYPCYPVTALQRHHSTRAQGDATGPRGQGPASSQSAFVGLMNECVSEQASGEQAGNERTTGGSEASAPWPQLQAAPPLVVKPLYETGPGLSTPSLLPPHSWGHSTEWLTVVCSPFPAAGHLDVVSRFAPLINKTAVDVFVCTSFSFL